MKERKRRKPSTREIDPFFLSLEKNERFKRLCIGQGPNRTIQESAEPQSSDIGRFCVCCVCVDACARVDSQRREKDLTNTVGRQSSVVCTRRVVSDLEEPLKKRERDNLFSYISLSLYIC